tara:strand:- start:1898 stop:3355 length:1458 start_codon:yes stop_codon:yes gene_type:complete
MSDQNINNFATIIEDSKIVKIIPKNSLLAFGYINKKSISKYSPAGIQWDNLLKQIQSEISSVPSIDTNTWDLLQTAFVDPNYTVGDGTVGDGNKPFQTVAQANLSGAPNIYLKPGTHQLYVESNKRYYAATGAVANQVSDLGTTATNVKILGDLTVTATFGLNFTGTDSDVYAEILEITGPSASWCDNNSSLYLKVKKGITTSCANGGGYSCRQYGGTMTIETPYYYSNYSIISPRGDGPEFILRCPDVKILDGGGYGNLNQSPIVIVGSFLTSPCRMEINLMGGILQLLNSVQSTTNGIPDSALFNVFSAGNAYSSIVEIKNGTCLANQQHGFYARVGDAINMRLNYKNLQVKSSLSAVRFINSGISIENLEATFINCNFESDLGNRLGYNVVADFNNTTFAVRTLATDIFTLDITAPTTPPIYRFKSSYFTLWNPGTGETFKDAGPATIGLLHSSSTEVLGVGVTDTWGGFNQVATLTLPNII